MADMVTITGNVGNDPQHLTSTSGVSITRFTVASTHRRFDKTTGTWSDHDTNWYNVSTFRHVADHAHSSISRGDPVIVIGRMVQRNWEVNGRTGTSMDIEADTVGLDLRWGTGSITRRSKAGEDVEPSDGGEVASEHDPESVPEDSDDRAESAASEEAPVPF